MKTQISMCTQKGIILSVHVAKGRKHDFQIFKETIALLLKYAIVYMDSGYEGAQKYIKYAVKPYKAYKNKPLTSKQKVHNRALARKRIVIEHINRKLKIFKIVSLPYRSRRKTFENRMKLIAAIVNKLIAA